MRQPYIFQASCIFITWLFIVPCHAFYRLWGYSDLRRNLENSRHFKAQSSLLTRGGKTGQKPLCHSFPDPSDTSLGVIRVVGVMNHPDLANPIQALGLWEEKDFNCGSFLPRLVIYFQPGQETQIIDLRQFGGEWVYTNWKQIIPGDEYWNAFVAPELTEEKKLGNGFVKKLTRVDNDHNFAVRADTVWDTQAPENSWIIDKRPGILSRDASKTGFESRFKLELGTLLEEEKSRPLGEEETRQLAVELTIMKQALAEQYAKWQMGRIEKHIQGLPQPRRNQFSKNVKADTPVFMSPFTLWDQPYGGQQGEIEQTNQIEQQIQAEQQVQGRNGDTEASIEVKEEPVERERIDLKEEAVKVEAVKEEGVKDEGVDTKEEEVQQGASSQVNFGTIQPGIIPSNTNLRTITEAGQGFMNYGNLRPQGQILDLQALMNRAYTPQSTNFMESLIQGYNPYASNRIPGSMVYTGQNRPWNPSFEEIITMRQQSLIQNELVRERQALEQALVQSGFLPIRPRLTPNNLADNMPGSNFNRFPAEIPPLAGIQGINTPVVNTKRVLPPASDILDSIEAEQLRKGFISNLNPQQPTWSQVQGQREEEESYQIPNPNNQLQDDQEYIRDLLGRSKKSDKRRTRKDQDQ
ncbi:hypothetical protein TWF718_007846 [Orbilia javanica]|uniref:Uncharacterized protein n=1 Tax=Orbilia javanica TaxID=47235 RepID=A0AAN8RH77_9PEZI